MSESSNIEELQTTQIDICGDGGVMKLILKKGKGPKPAEGT